MVVKKIAVITTAIAIMIVFKCCFIKKLKISERFGPCYAPPTKMLKHGPNVLFFGVRIQFSRKIGALQSKVSIQIARFDGHSVSWRQGMHGDDMLL